MIERTKRGTVHVLRTDSPLTADASAELARAGADCLGSGQPRIVVDLTGAALIDSAAMDTLLDLHDECLRRGGGLRLAAAPPLCREILSLVGVVERTPIFEDVSSAVGSFAR